MVTTELQSHFGDKGVNKAGATAQTTKLSSLVIREQAGATRQTRRHRGGSPRSSAAAAGRPGWTVPSLLRPQLLCPWTAPVDEDEAVHRAPDRCRHVVAPPLHKAREEARGAYKRSRCSTVARDRPLVTPSLATRAQGRRTLFPCTHHCHSRAFGKHAVLGTPQAAIYTSRT
jgi:hypothetical protein